MARADAATSSMGFMATSNLRLRALTVTENALSDKSVPRPARRKRVRRSGGASAAPCRFSRGVPCNPLRRAYLSDAGRAPLAIDGDRDVEPRRDRSLLSD